MADDNRVLGSTAVRPKEYEGMEAVKMFLHNKETGQFCTRTPKSWGLICLFYLIYYTCLAGFWALMMLIFLQTISYDHPKWETTAGIIGDSPGVGIRPKQSEKLIDSSIFLFNKESTDNKGDVEGWKAWADRTEAFLAPYKNASGSANTVDCSKLTGDRSDEDAKKACKVDLKKLGPCGKPSYGYDRGEPCVFLKLNKIYGLEQGYYNDSADLPGGEDGMPLLLKTYIESRQKKPKAYMNMVWVDCHGEYSADQEVLKNNIHYYPERGFPGYYYPFLRQKDYLSPLVAVQFKGLRPGQLTHIECRAWAKNIGYSRRDKVGIGRFEILVMDQKLTDVRYEALS